MLSRLFLLRYTALSVRNHSSNDPASNIIKEGKTTITAGGHPNPTQTSLLVVHHLETIPTCSVSLFCLFSFLYHSFLLTYLDFLCLCVLINEYYPSF